MQQPIPRNSSGLADLARRASELDVALSYVLGNAKPAHLWRVGIEYEAIGFGAQNHSRISRDDVQRVMSGFVARGGVPLIEVADVVAVRMPYGEITLEPGGQIEFSGAPEIGLTPCASALHRFLCDLHECAQRLQVFFMGLGFDPVCGLGSQSWIRKRRYAIMRPYLAQRGSHAWDMMTRTAAAQVSIDYADEEDLGRKYVLGNRLGPVVAAMFANSPFAEGKPTGLKSTRYAVWLDTDPDRSGPGPGTFDDTFDLAHVLRSLLEVPLFFVVRQSRLHDVAGAKLSAIPDAGPDDFASLLSMIFTEARIREYVELRSADSGAPAMAVALAALWKGLTYDAGTLQDALGLAPRLGRAEYRALQTNVARDGLAAKAHGINVLALAREVVALATNGLQRIAPHEVHYLDPLAQNVMEDGVCPADLALAKGSVERAIQASVVA